MPQDTDDGRPRTTKTVMFYKSGDDSFQGVTLPVNARRYRTIDALLDDLSRKVPGMPFGVRRLCTPDGKHDVKNIDDLDHMGRYVCSGKLETRPIQGIHKDIQKPPIRASPTHSSESSSDKPPKKIKTKRPDSVSKIPEPEANKSPSRRRAKSQEPGKAKSQKENASKSPRQSRKTKKSETRDKSKSPSKKTKKKASVDLAPLDEMKLKDAQLRRLTSREGSPLLDSQPPKEPKKKKTKKTTEGKGDSPKKKSTKAKKKDAPTTEEMSKPEPSATTPTLVLEVDDVEEIEAVKKEEEETEGNTTKRLYTPNTAATKIQSHYRGYRVRKEMHKEKEKADDAEDAHEDADEGDTEDAHVDDNDDKADDEDQQEEAKSPAGEAAAQEDAEKENTVQIWNLEGSDTEKSGEGTDEEKDD